MAKYSEEEEMRIEDLLAMLFAIFYILIPWRKIGVKSSYRFFLDRIRASSSARNAKELSDTFAKKCNVDFAKIPTEIIQELDEYNDLTMRLVRKESLYIANLALEKAEELKEQKKLAKSGQTTL